ncbi:hypothetical protein QEH56_06910 [Pelagicoccus enzymogenes]|uniref:hypothetical protein n=1 Tax=Pelagicoccus enzymogenes TaxID=2773457 RepID=UPI00280DD8A5|nr:hypothetical protein [Pelagicoccus enzymogenes]MDQ8197869.1 hypothetical protein [Pelagicoccus enzymogenes]
MPHPIKFLLLSFTTATLPLTAADIISIDSQESWIQNSMATENLDFTNGLAVPTATESSFTSKLIQYPEKRSAKSITFEQSDLWENWQEVPNVGPKGAADAPVLLPVADGDYWFFARNNAKDPATGKPIPGYHAWHSQDMETWTHYGPVSDHRSRWVTTAEHVDGAFYIYYDHPNDEDPHLIIDRDLRDGKMGEDLGMVFSDPSHGSDCSILRDIDGRFHLIYENWDHIDARQHSWDAPVAGHAVSPDGINDFQILDYAVDNRTKPTGRFATFTHPFNPEIMRYEIHEPEQNAYGDWTNIRIGDQYYLFCDYHPAHDKIRIGRWTSDSLDKQFIWCGELGMGHPDPTIGFAEGKFYLLQQRGDTDFVSPGPWVEGVTARVGVDTDNDGKIDQWTEWQDISETYNLRPGFSRVVDKTPAAIDLTSLPAGYGHSFEFRTEDLPKQVARPKMKSITLEF